MVNKLTSTSEINESKKHGKLFVIAGSSGAGKTTLVNQVITTMADKYKVSMQRVVTYTTKAPRLGDVVGRDYHYISESDFHEKIAAGFFLEWSSAYGHYYGSAHAILDLLDTGAFLCLILDIAGVAALKKLNLSDAIYIWISVDNEILAQRLVARQTENATELAQRLQLAQQETALMADNELALFDFTIYNNNNLNGALVDLEQLFACKLGL